MKQTNHPGAASPGPPPLRGHGRDLHHEVTWPIGMILQKRQPEAPSSSGHKDPDHLGLVALLRAIGGRVYSPTST
jgi:hypothetical protein